MARAEGRAAALALPTVALLVGSFFYAAYLLSDLLGFPSSLDLPLVLRVVGFVMVVAGLAFAGWVFRYRSPLAMAASTYVTFTKLFGRAPVARPSGRTEPLVVAGPHRYTRNPLYFGVVVMTFGWALAGSSTFVLIGAVFLLLWFRLVLIPFEEKELRALFGGRYERYSEGVPLLVPFTKRKR